MSILLTGATVVRSLDPPRLERGDLLVRERHVVGPIPGAANEAPLHAARLDCSGCLVIPGNVCAHTHVYSALARGMPYRLPAPSSFLEILQRIWWRLDRALEPETIRASALVAAHEALASGTTTLVDHHASPNAIDGSLDIIAEAFEEVGIRGVLCYETSDRDGAKRARDGVEENRRFLQRVAEGRWPLARGMVGAHASFTLSEETLAASVSVAREAGVGIHLHVAEDALDEADAVARYGRRVAHRLHAAGALDERALLAHAVHVDPAEAELIRATRATVAHNPRSNMNNAVGRAPLAWMRGRLALGSDGISGDMFEESRAAYLRRREDGLDAGLNLPLELLARGATVAGRAFGEPLFGHLDPGAPADLVVLDYAPPTPLQAENLAGHWTFGLGALQVRHVIVGGELVLRDGRTTRVDPQEIAVEARRAASRLWSRMDGIAPHSFAPSVLLATVGGS
jgi:putative selenium metabolism protein SsnA